MMSFWKSVEGMVHGTLTGAEPEKTLLRLNQAGIRLYRVEWAGGLTVRFFCSRRDQRAIVQLCQKRGDRVIFRERGGLVPVCRAALGRPLLSSGILCLLLLTLVLPTRVLFFRVEGNETVPTRQILEAAEACGIRFGVSRKSIRSERMKNALLEAMPELKWAGINTAGCTAVISVRERSIPRQTPSLAGISSIVADRDAYITGCTVTRGNALCQPGQVVREGETLISGYTDCGICIQVTGAEGEIYGQTSRSLEVVAPDAYRFRGTPIRQERRYSLIIGKKRINLWKDSGIWDATCGRIYEQYHITLPGGFQLPVALGVQTLTFYEMSAQSRPLEPELKTFARRTVLDQTIAGQILQQSHTVTQTPGAYRLSSRFLCSEMIGRVITEEIGELHGKTD